MSWAFIKEVGDGLLVALGRSILCLQSGMQIMQRMVNLNEIEECLAPRSMLVLNDATFVGARD